MVGVDERGWIFPWLCFQCKVGGAVCHCTRWSPHHPRPVGPARRPEKHQGLLTVAKQHNMFNTLYA